MASQSGATVLIPLRAGRFRAIETRTVPSSLVTFSRQPFQSAAETPFFALDLANYLGDRGRELFRVAYLDPLRVGDGRGVSYEVKMATHSAPRWACAPQMNNRSRLCFNRQAVTLSRSTPFQLCPTFNSGLPRKDKERRPEKRRMVAQSRRASAGKSAHLRPARKKRYPAHVSTEHSGRARQLLPTYLVSHPDRALSGEASTRSLIAERVSRLWPDARQMDA